MKEAIDSRSRGNKVNLSRGSKTGSERNVMQSGPTHASYNGIFFIAGYHPLPSAC